jgi:hypothetical protein
MKTFALALLLAALAAAPAHASDTVVATVAKSTTIDAYGGRAVWSTWDPAISAYRLTVYNAGRIRTLPVPPNVEPFEVDLGPGPRGGTVAIYTRCRLAVDIAVDREGRRGCDLYLYRFTTGRETKLTRPSTSVDEHWPTIWGKRIAFVRVTSFSRRAMYWGTARFHRLHDGPLEGGFPEQLDMRGGRVAFVWQYEWGADLSLSTTAGRGRLLVRMPGSGAEVFDLTAQGPTVGRRSVHWALSIGQATPVFSELRQVALKTLKEQRATVRIDAPSTVNRATAGFAQDRGTSWYVRVPATDRFEIHMARGLTYKPAPPPRPPRM